MTFAVLLTDDAARDLDELYAHAFLRGSASRGNGARRENGASRANAKRGNSVRPEPGGPGGSADPAESFLTLFRAAFERLAREPEAGRPPAELAPLGLRDYRQLTLPGYRIIYRVVGEEVQVLLIGNDHRSLQGLLERRLLEY